MLRRFAFPAHDEDSQCIVSGITTDEVRDIHELVLDFTLWRKLMEWNYVEDGKLPEENTAVGYCSPFFLWLINSFKKY